VSKVTVRDLKRHLAGRTHNELVGDIADLFSKLDAVKDYYQLRLGDSADEDVLVKYKKSIQHEFFPEHGYGLMRLSVARKAIADYKKVAASLEGVIELMLFYVETGVAFTNAYGDIDEPFYNSMESMYARTLELIAKQNLQDRFEARCRKIVDDTTLIGWGFHDALSELYHEHFER
jgi:uncharacterized protein DUF6155